MRVLLLALALLAGGARADGWEAHWDARAPVIAAHQSIAGPESALLLGDSITEQEGWWIEYDSCRSVNGGFGGISAKNLAARIASHVPGMPRYVWLMIGTNTANLATPADELSAYESHVTAILQNLWARGARVILVSIPPIDRNKSFAASNFGQDRVNYLNGVLYGIAQRYGLPFVNANYAFMDLDPSSANYGNALPWVTQADGIHLTRDAYVRLYYMQRDALRQAITPSLPCWG